MNNISIPPNFIDVYLPFMQCLVDSEQTELIDIYELATQYFECKVEEMKERTVNNVERNRSSSQRDISSKHGTDPIKPDFTFDSSLEQFPINLYPEQLDSTNLGPKVHEKRKTKTLEKKRDSSESLKADSATRDELLEKKLKFSQLLPGNIKVKADLTGSSNEKSKATHALGELQESGLNGVVKKPETHIQNERTEKEDHTTTKYSKAKETDVKIQMPKCDSRTQTKFTGRPSELNPLSATEQGTSSYVRNVAKAAKHLMDSINNGIEQRIEPGRHEIEGKETEIDEVRRILENCLHSLKLKESYPSIRTHQDSASKPTMEGSESEKNATLQGELYETFPEHEPQIILGRSFYELVGNNSPNAKEVQTVSDSKESRKSSPEEFFIPKKEIKVAWFKTENPKEINEITIEAGTASNFLEPGTELSLDAVDDLESERFFKDSPLASNRSEIDEDRKQFLTSSSLTESLSSSSSESSSSSDNYFLIKDKLFENTPISNYSENTSSSRELPHLGPRESIGNLTLITSQVEEKLKNFITNNCDEEHPHSDYQTTFQMQSKMQKVNNPHFQLPANKGGICMCDSDKLLTTLDSVTLPIDGRSWLRTYFTVQMINRFQKAANSDVPCVENTDLGTSMFKQCDTECRYSSNFRLQNLFGAIRTWYFNRTFREYQKQSTT